MNLTRWVSLKALAPVLDVRRGILLADVVKLGIQDVSHLNDLPLALICRGSI